MNLLLLVVVIVAIMIDAFVVYKFMKDHYDELKYIDRHSDIISVSKGLLLDFVTNMGSIILTIIAITLIATM